MIMSLWQHGPSEPVLTRLILREVIGLNCHCYPPYSFPTTRQNKTQTKLSPPSVSIIRKPSQSRNSCLSPTIPKRSSVAVKKKLWSERQGPSGRSYVLRADRKAQHSTSKAPACQTPVG